jgi:hypothetical protein
MLSNEATSDERIEGSLRNAPILPGQKKNLPELASGDVPGEGIEMDPEPVAHLAGGEPAGRSCRGGGAHTVTAQRQQSRKAARARIGSGVQVRISPLIDTL